MDRDQACLEISRLTRHLVCSQGKWRLGGSQASGLGHWVDGSALFGTREAWFFHLSASRLHSFPRRFFTAPLLWSLWQDVSCGHSLGICSSPRLCFPTLSHRCSWDTEKTLFAGVVTGGLSGSEEREGSLPSTPAPTPVLRSST